MNEGKNSWDKLVNLPDDYQPNSELAEKAISTIKSNKKTESKRNRKPFWISIAASIAVCLVGLAVFLPLYLPTDVGNEGNERLYYSSESITFSNVDNISEFATQNNLEIYYFDNEMTTNNCAYTIEDNKLAFINQNSIFFDDSNYAIIELKIIVLHNVDFYFDDNFKGLSDIIEIKGVTINFHVTVTDTDEQTCKIRFTFNDVTYCMFIDSDYCGVETVEKYVTLLLN